MMELNNVNALIRTYSRMVSCSFLMLMAMSATTFGDLQGNMVQICLISFFMILFHTYQNKNATGWVFYAYLCVGLASLPFIQILFFVPFFWLFQRFYMISFSWRTFFASIIGLITPYWFLAAFFLLTNQPMRIVTTITRIAEFQPMSSWQPPSEHLSLTLIFVFLLGLTGTIHFLRYSYQDKIRIRMIYYVFIATWLLSSIFAAVQPQHAPIMLKVMMISTSALIAHFITLTKTRITNVAFLLILVCLILLTVYNLWMPSFLY
jgi:hypothetical protein